MLPSLVAKGFGGLLVFAVWLAGAIGGIPDYAKPLLLALGTLIGYAAVRLE